MAKQIKFFSQTTVPSGTDTAIGGNVYFVNGANNGNEIYKGAVRFGAPRVTKATTSNALSAIAGMIRGDINVGYQGTKVYDGQNWIAMVGNKGDWIPDINNAVDGLIYSEPAASSTGDQIPGYNLVTAITGTKNADGLIELSAVVTTFKFGDVIPYNVLKSANVAAFADLKKDDKIPTAYAVYNAVNAESTRLTGLIDNKASKGTGNATGAHGVSGTFTLKSDSATHDFTLDVKSAALATNFSTSDYFTTGSIVYGHTVGLAAGDNTKYINKIAYNAATGKLTATASATAHASASITNATNASYTLADVWAVKSYVTGITDNKASVGSGNANPSYGVSGTFTLKSDSGTHDFTMYVKPLTTSAEISGANSAASVPTGKAVVDYVDAKVSGMGDVLVFKSTSYDNNATYAKGDVILFADNDNGWGLNESGIATSDGVTIPFTQGMEIVCTGLSSSDEKFHWEVIGNQNKWVDKVTGGTSTSTNHNVSVKVTTDAVTAKPTVVVTAPAYNAGESTKTSTNNNHTVTVTTKEGQVTGVTITAPAKFTVGEIGSSTLTSTSNGHEVTVGTTNGKVSSVVLAAPSRFTVSEIGNGASTSTRNGVTISVSTVSGVQKSANITITPAALNADLSTSTFLVTGSTMYDHTSGLAQGTTGSYIESISYVDGKLTATATTFPSHDYNPDAVTKSGTNNGTTVSVTTQNGKVTKVEVAASNWKPGTATKSGTSNNIKVDVTTTAGVVTAVAVSSPFIATEVTKSGTSNGHTVSVTTENGQVTAVAVAAPAVATATTKSSASKGVEVSVTGHITAVSVVTTLSTTLGDDANHAPTTKAVYEALCWYSANGNLIP